jgi:hypothetical protein
MTPGHQLRTRRLSKHTPTHAPGRRSVGGQIRSPRRLQCTPLLHPRQRDPVSTPLSPSQRFSSRTSAGGLVRSGSCSHRSTTRRPSPDATQRPCSSSAHGPGRVRNVYATRLHVLKKAAGRDLGRPSCISCCVASRQSLLENDQLPGAAEITGAQSIEIYPARHPATVLIQAVPSHSVVPTGRQRRIQ